MGGFKDKLPSGTSLTSGTVTATSPETTDDDDDDDEDAAEEQPAGKTVTQSLTFQDVDGKSPDVADAVKDALVAQDAALPTSTITVTEGEALDGKGSVTVKIVWECGADAAKKGIAEGFANGLVDSADTMATFVTGFKDKLPSGTSLTSGTVTATSPETTDDDDDDDEDAAEEQPAGKTVTQSLTFQDVDGKSQDVADAVKDALAAQDAALPTSTITVTEGEALDGKGSVTVKIVWECGADAAKKGIAEG